MKYFFSILLIVLLVQYSYASEEGVLVFSDFTIKSNGIGSSGPIVVNGRKDNNGRYSQISVEAFGKTQLFPEKILTQIPSQYQNGIQLSYEAGYKQLGGKTVYIVFYRGFLSGIKEKFIISISEDGRSQIIDRY